MKKFVLFMMCSLFVLAFSLHGTGHCKLLMPETEKNILGAAYFKDGKVNIAIANNSDEKQYLKISYGYYELNPVKVHTKDILVGSKEVMLLAFNKAYAKTKTGQKKTCDTVFIYNDSGELLNLINVQGLTAGTNYFKCYSYFMNDYKMCRILLNLNALKNENYIYIVDKNPLSSSGEADITLQASGFMGLNQINSRDLYNIDIDKDYIEQICKESSGSCLFYGAGYMYLRITTGELEKAVLVSPKIKKYHFGTQGVTSGNISTPQILFYPQKYKVKEL
ncbi:MAG: hypothetical protein ABIH00_07935 [Armatimonadota bacterium]